MEFLSNTFYLIVVIAIIVLVHELGHFLAAKLFRMRVEKFSIGFGPRIVGKQIGDTEYRIGWLPLGGYVKIAGMIDESLDTDHLTQEVKDDEYRAKPIWQRSIVISAGVIMNFLLALAIFWGLNLTRGRQVHETTVVGYVKDSTAAALAGLQAGDRIVDVNGERALYWEDVDRLVMNHALDGPASIGIERNGARLRARLSAPLAKRLETERFGVWGRGARPVISDLEPDRPASKAGMRAGDIVRNLAGRDVHTIEEVTGILTAHPLQPVVYVVERNGTRDSGTVIPNEDGKVGIAIRDDLDAPATTLHYSVATAFTAGVSELYGITVLTVQNLWHVVTGRASFKQSIGGPVRIAKMATQQAQLGLASFLLLIAVISIGIAILNILPFPVLDGGQLVYLLYERIMGREIPVKLHLGLQYAGMIILMSFMLFVLYNDIVQ
jgi:regulator of sigma E protease